MNITSHIADNPERYNTIMSLVLLIISASFVYYLMRLSVVGIAHWQFRQRFDLNESTGSKPEEPDMVADSVSSNSNLADDEYESEEYGEDYRNHDMGCCETESQQDNLSEEELYATDSSDEQQSDDVFSNYGVSETESVNDRNDAVGPVPMYGPIDSD